MLLLLLLPLLLELQLLLPLAVVPPQLLQVLVEAPRRHLEDVRRGRDGGGVGEGVAPRPEEKKVQIKELQEVVSKHRKG